MIYLSDLYCMIHKLLHYGHPHMATIWVLRETTAHEKNKSSRPTDYLKDVQRQYLGALFLLSLRQPIATGIVLRS